MNLIQMIRVAPAALLMLSLCNVAQAEQQRAVLILDTSVEQVSGARMRLGFERLPAADEKAIWADPDGRGDNIAIAVLAGGGAIGLGISEAHAQAERIPGAQIVTLSWDDRQPLLAMDLRAYARRGSDRGVTVREKARSVVRYVGYQAPAGQDPRAYWAADDASAFVTEVQAGLQRMLSVVWDDTTKAPKVSRKETTTVDIAGSPQVFPGRLWKQDEGAAYLFNKDRGITIVATAAPPAP